MNLRTSPVALYAAVMLVAGLTMLFMPAWFLMSTFVMSTLVMSTSLGVSGDPAGVAQTVFVQLTGAAFIGFAASNWIARHAPLGGIYGRAVVIGNQAFSLVGALILLGNIPAEPRAGFWLLLLIFIAGAALHGMLLFKSPKSAVAN